MRKLAARGEGRGDVLAHAIIHVALGSFAIACIYPFILTFMASITSERSISRNGLLLVPKELSTRAYELVFRDGTVFNGFKISAIVTLVGTILAVTLCGLAGFALSNPALRYRNKIAMYFYIPMVFSAGLLPWYLVVTQILHLQNTLLALIVPPLVSPFNIFLMRNYFKTIPTSLVEAAEIDGSSPWGIFFKIVMPLSKPILATVTLFIALGYWNDWTNALWFIDNRNLYPLQYLLYRIQAIMEFIRQYGSLGGASLPTQTFQYATLFVTIGPIILLYPFLQKYFVKGIMIGAVKS